MKSILLIDDRRDPENIRDPHTAENYFDPQKVEIARTGEIGIEKLKSQKWEILLLDHDLGSGISGMGVLNFLEVNKECMPSRIYLVTANVVSGPLMYEIIEEWHNLDLIKNHYWIR